MRDVGDLACPARDRRMVDAATLVGDEARADLDDEPGGARERRHVSPADGRRRRSRTEAGVTTTGSLGCVAGISAAAGGCASSHSWMANVNSRQPLPSIAEIPNTSPLVRN